MKTTPNLCEITNQSSIVICSIESSIAILILKIDSIASLPNSIAGLKVGHFFQIGPWSQISVI
jgi:hypothetical protein